MLNIYLPPYCKEVESFYEDGSNKTHIKNEALRMLQNNNNTGAKKLNREQEESLRQKSKLLLRPKLYNLQFLRPYMKLTDNEHLPREKSKMIKTNFDLNFARSVDLNSLSPQFSDIDDDLSEPYELSDSEMVEKSYLDFYEKTIDLVRKQKNDKLNLKRVSSIPLLSASKEQACRRDLVRRVLKFKNVFGYNISSNQLLSAKKMDKSQIESGSSAKPRHNNTARTSKSSNFDRRSSNSSKSNESVTYFELISDRNLNLINEKKSKYLNFFK